MTAFMARRVPTTHVAAAAGAEDAAFIAITLTGSDSDGIVQSFSLSSLPANGSLYTDAGLTTLAATGIDYTATAEALTFYFVPNADFNGSASFDYAAKDDAGDSDITPATVTITVSPVNDDPVVNADAYATDEDTVLAITAGTSVLANDTDIDLDGLSVAAFDAVSANGGTVAMNPDGSFVYTPAADFSGAGVIDGLNASLQLNDNTGEDQLSEDTPSVTTNKDDYAPGETATITTRGLDVGATVTFEVDHVYDAGSDGVFGTSDDIIVQLGGEGHDPWTVTDGGIGDIDGEANGTITTEWYVNPDDSINERFLLTATDTATDLVASTSFTDAPTIVEVRVSASEDDVEERVSGSVKFTSSDLELVDDGTSKPDQTIGLRFNGLNIPQGAIITSAYIQFQVDEVDSGTTSLLIHGDDTDNALAFTSAKFDVSNRPSTDAIVPWSPVPWTTKGEAGPDQQTPDIASIIQEVVAREGWVANNSIALIITGSGERTAESYNGVPTAAPLLHVEWTAPGPVVAFNTPADADPNPDQIAENAAAGTAVGITASATDPDAGDTVTYSVDDPRFAIDASGVIMRSGTGTLDFETEPTITLTVTATSSDTSTATQAFTFGVTNINEAPVNTVPGTQIVGKETQTAIAGISVADEDAGAGNITTRLQVTAGVLDVTLSGTATISAGANSSSDLTIQGTVTDVNATLASLLYTGNTDITGIAADTLTIATDDGGNTGIGGPQQDLDNVQIDITEVNDAPVNTVPGTQIVDEEIQTAIAGISVADEDAGAGNITTRLQVAAGVLDVTLSGAATISAGANSSSDLTIQGTVTEVNATLASLLYTGNTDITGIAADTLTITTDDGGNTGIGGPQQDLDNVQIDITAVNDDPTNAGSMPSDIAVTVDVPSNVDLSAIDLSDVDADSGNLTVTLTTSTGGNLSASSGGGVTVAGSGTGTLTLTGTLTGLNTFLDTASNITYLHGTPGSSGNDADTIQVDVTDNGNTGIGGGGTLNVSAPNVDIADDVNEPTIAEVRVSASADDVEERTSGSVKFTSSDLELVDDGTKRPDQTIGLRFNGLDIPQGAIITSAYIQFQVDEVDSGTTSLLIHGDDTGNALAFTGTNSDVSNRPSTDAIVPWSPVPWTTVGEAGPDQQTPDIASIIQEVVNRGDWTANNSMALIITGTGERTAESFDGVAAAAPLLHVEWVLPTGGPPTSFDLTGTQIEENAVADAVVGTFGNVFDPDVGDIHTFSLQDDAGGRFKIVGDELQVADGSLLDFEDAISHDITVRVTDSEFLFHDETFTIAVNDVNEVPVANDDTALTQSDTLVVIDVLANDDLGDGLFSITSGVASFQGGTVFNNGDGTFDYTPPTGYTGPDSFTYTITDINGPETSTAMVAASVIPPSTPAISFWVIGDTPYTAGAESALIQYLDTVPQEVEFITHVGDIKSGSSACSLDVYQNVSGILQDSPVAVFITPGDNEYNDCSDPTAAFANWESEFSLFDQNWVHNFQVSYQVGREENFAFVSDGVLFIGINLVGGSVHDAQEFTDRSADDLAWIEANFAQFGDQVTSTVIFGHASPTKSVYQTFEDGLILTAQDFDKPILYLQGDQHQWLLDQPLADATNFTRVIIEKTGDSADSDPLLVSVSADPDDPFSFDHDFGLIA